jgi:hypothetical protein
MHTDVASGSVVAGRNTPQSIERTDVYLVGVLAISVVDEVLFDYFTWLSSHSADETLHQMGSVRNPNTPSISWYRGWF